MARYAQLVATGLPSGVPVTIKQSGVQVSNLFPSADAQAPDNRARTGDGVGALSPATYVPNGTYSVAWSGGSTTVVVSGASGVPDPSPFEAQAVDPGTYQPLRVVTSTAYAATITPAVTAGVDQVVNVGTLTGNLTLAAPTGSPTDGQKLTFRFVQDATGSRTITFNAAYAFGSDITTVLVPTSASAKWEMLFVWHAGDAKWRADAIVRGF